MQPPTLPRNRSMTDSAGICPWCMEAKGVAAVTASAVDRMPAAFRNPTLTQLLISTGQLKRKARPASAGFRKFLPMPPKSCLTMTMANRSPRMMVQ